MGAVEQAEWMAFDLAQRGALPKPEPKPPEPPENMTLEQSRRWVLENQWATLTDS